MSCAMCGKDLGVAKTDAIVSVCKSCWGIHFTPNTQTKLIYGAYADSSSYSSVEQPIYGAQIDPIIDNEEIDTIHTRYGGFVDRRTYLKDDN
jgi:ribosome-binding protein aMBF1 (putative translation factor)